MTMIVTMMIVMTMIMRMMTMVRCLGGSCRLGEPRDGRGADAADRGVSVAGGVGCHGAHGGPGGNRGRCDCPGKRRPLLQRHGAEVYAADLDANACDQGVTPCYDEAAGGEDRDDGAAAAHDNDDDDDAVMLILMIIMRTAMMMMMPMMMTIRAIYAHG